MMTRPGETAILAPRSGLGVANGRAGLWAASTQGDVAAVLSQFSSAYFDQVVVTLDSVVFDDGLVIGPDTLDVVDQQTDWAKGTRQILAQALAQIQSGDFQLADVSSRLKDATSRHSTINPNTGRPDFCGIARIAVARKLVMLRTQSDDATFVRAVDAMIDAANQSRPGQIVLHRGGPQ